MNPGQIADIEAKNEQEQAEREAMAQSLQDMQNWIISLKKEKKTLKAKYKEKQKKEKVKNEKKMKNLESLIEQLQ